MVVLVFNTPHHHYRIDTTDTNMIASITAARPAPDLCLHLLVPHLVCRQELRHVCQNSQVACASFILPFEGCVKSDQLCNGSLQR